PFPFDPRSAERRAESEQHQRRRERRVRRAEPPRRVRYQRLNRPIERAPRVHRPDANVNENRADGNEPTIRALGRHEPLPCSSGGPGGARKTSREFPPIVGYLVMFGLL